MGSWKSYINEADKIQMFLMTESYKHISSQNQNINALYCNKMWYDSRTIKLSFFGGCRINYVLFAQVDDSLGS